MTTRIGGGSSSLLDYARRAAEAAEDVASRVGTTVADGLDSLGKGIAADAHDRSAAIRAVQKDVFESTKASKAGVVASVVSGVVGGAGEMVTGLEGLAGNLMQRGGVTNLARGVASGVAAVVTDPSATAKKLADAYTSAAGERGHVAVITELALNAATMAPTAGAAAAKGATALKGLTGAARAEARVAASTVARATEIGEELAVAARSATTPGTPLSVLRSNGALESGWRVQGSQAGKVIVSRGELTKSVPLRDVLRTNPELIPRDVPVVVRRSSGAMDDGWTVLGNGEKPGQVVVGKAGSTKAVSVDELLDNNSLRLTGEAPPRPASARATAPAEPAPPEPVTAPAGPARVQADAFAKSNRIGPGERIVDGYIDGGRTARVGADGRVTSTREIIVVDRTKDAALRAQLEYAKGLRNLPVDERVRQLSQHIDRLMTSPVGLDAESAVNGWLSARRSQSVLLGDVSALGGGVCRHRSLLFKVLGDEAGLDVALVRGNARFGSASGGHAWNEVRLGSGQRAVMDVMNPLPGHAPRPISSASQYHTMDWQMMYGGS